MYNEFKKSIKLWNYSYNSVTIVKNLPNTQELDYAIYRKKRNDLTIYLTKKGAYMAFFEYHGDKEAWVWLLQKIFRCTDIWDAKRGWVNKEHNIQKMPYIAISRKQYFPSIPYVWGWLQRKTTLSWTLKYPINLSLGPLR